MISLAGWLLYGAYGYTGRLVARRAVELGMQPVLAGRDAEQLGAMAEELNCDFRVANLDQPDELAAALKDIGVVVHCAGPFARTSEPMVQACLDAGAHYIDITGEISVLNAVLNRDDQARQAGVVLLPGGGFDVVPTDCLAAIAARDLAEPVQSIELAFLTRSGMSGGTARTGIEGLHHGRLRVRDGRLVPISTDERRRSIKYVTKTVESSAISWGDLATAPRSTGARDVIVHTATPVSAELAMRALGAIFRIGPLRRLLQPRLASLAGSRSGPTGEQLHRPCELWARATDAAGRSVERRMVTPNGYLFTADSTTRIVRCLLAGHVPPGAHTPSTALGADFVLQLDGVELH